MSSRKEKRARTVSVQKSSRAPETTFRIISYPIETSQLYTARNALPNQIPTRTQGASIDAPKTYLSRGAISRGGKPGVSGSSPGEGKKQTGERIRDSPPTVRSSLHTSVGVLGEKLPSGFTVLAIELTSVGKDRGIAGDAPIRTPSFHLAGEVGGEEMSFDDQDRKRRRRAGGKAKQMIERVDSEEKGKKEGNKFERKLVKFKDLPEYMKDNEYILDYYRCEWPLKDAILSLFSWHNETLNVWT
ncbi:hypothetical protein CDL15_Pgr015277 [Punica granatum]|uniref:Uncharacterized protein n=2 Tax=Punica granatum TaxID=22663 RepID=A0A218W147_PUNGR|nr:hypothetical protein CDL15_Pgr015277 [Punica granatum]